ncbi:hypothetical protein ElyMa_002579100 [Elysia marginata]|uniref:Uncharacterized protein n=1 Tax=Elysia marginata TaxID=1093978 RepID=A0AAV4H044_9GAST|nr:hypothetical protein ElyMa_002579100 [Elysia marginata]
MLSITYAIENRADLTSYTPTLSNKTRDAGFPRKYDSQLNRLLSVQRARQPIRLDYGCHALYWHPSRLHYAKTRLNKLGKFSGLYNVVSLAALASMLIGRRYWVGAQDLGDSS